VQRRKTEIPRRRRALLRGRQSTTRFNVRKDRNEDGIKCTHLPLDRTTGAAVLI
jgi:hypothetical protein